MHIFHEEEIRQHVQINSETIAVVEEAFTALATKKVEMPPIMRVDIPENNGEVDIKTAYIPGYDLFALKVSSGFFNNYSLGLPSTNGLMMLIHAKTGIPEALLLDNGYLTDVRTAAAGAVAANYMANEQIKTVGVIGAGAQARYQLRALKEVRNFQRVIVYGPTEKRVRECKEEIEQSLQVPVHIAKDSEEVVAQSDVVITTTPATEPVIKKEWVKEGLHITAMGSDAEHKQELDPEIIAMSNYYVADVRAQCSRLGELRAALETGIIAPDAPITELGTITLKQQPIRSKVEDITVADLTGTGAQDTMIALYAYQQLMKKSEEGMVTERRV